MHKNIFSHVYLIILILITIALISGVWLVMLRRLVSKRTRELTERNEMLGQVRDGLDKTVAERTAELSSLNAALMSEITERKKSEEALRLSEEKFRSLAEQSITGTCIIQDGRLVYVNPRLAEILDFSQEEMTGLQVLDLVAEKDRDMVRENIRKRISGEVSFMRYIFYALKKDGSEVPLEVHGSTMIYNGRPAIMATLLDITARKKTEENLHALLSRQKALLEAIPDIIMAVDSNKVYTWANQAGIKFFGEDVIGKEAAYYFEGEQATYNVVQPLFDGSEDVLYIESWQRRKDGQKRLLAWWCKVI